MSKSSSNIIFSNLVTFKNIDQTLSNFQLIGSSNRFITNDRYEGSITITNSLFTSNITTSKLNVLGDTTILNISVYKSEQLEVLNEASATAVKIMQKNKNYNILEVINSNNDISFIIDKNSNIGIGIANPEELLHLHNINSNIDVSIKFSDANNTSGVILKKDSNQDFYISNTNQNGDIILGVNNKPKTVVITQDGNIGINKNNPSEILDIIGNIKIKGNIIPDITNIYNLGSSSNRWKDIYLSGNSINLDNIIISRNEFSNLEIKDINGTYKEININKIELHNNNNNNTFKLLLDNNGNLIYEKNNTLLYPSFYTIQSEASNSVTSNVLSNTSNTLVNYINLYNKSDIYTKDQTSNIFVTSNVLSNTLANYPLPIPRTRR